MIERKLIRPESMAEALGEREQYGKDAMPIAGGNRSWYCCETN